MKDPVIAMQILNKTPPVDGRDMTRRRLPSLWETPAPVDRAPVRLQRAIRSRLDGKADEATGARRRSRVYLDDEKALVQYIRAMRRDGLSEAEIREHNSFQVAAGNNRWRTVHADEALRLINASPDILPPHSGHIGSQSPGRCGPAPPGQASRCPDRQQYGP